MKILQICPPWISIPPKGYGGTENVIYNLVEGLISESHEVTIFSTGDSRFSGDLKYVFKKDLVSQKIDWNAALPPLVHYHQAFKHAKQNNYDIVHTHLSSGTDLASFAFISELETPSITTVHGHWPYDRFSTTDNYYLKYYADAVSVVNISKVMEKFLPPQLEAIGTVYNGIDTSKIKANFKYNPSGYLTWLGVIVPDKNLHEAILAVKKSGDRMVFGGLVEPSRPDSVIYFETKVKPLIDNYQIKYLGQLNFEEKIKMLTEAKGFLNPIAWEEPFGMVMIESMSCGTPVISYSRGAAKEIITEGKTGFLVNNIEEMSTAIGRIGELRRQDCREHIESNFSSIAMVKGYLDIYRKRLDIARSEVKYLGVYPDSVKSRSKVRFNNHTNF